jgi:hypothetical protein
LPRGETLADHDEFLNKNLDTDQFEMDL